MKRPIHTATLQETVEVDFNEFHDVVVSADYDGCFDTIFVDDTQTITGDGNAIERTEHTQPPRVRKEQESKRHPLFLFLQSLGLSTLLDGSLRQSWLTDYYNQKLNANGLCLDNFPKLAGWLEITFDNYLINDSLQRKNPGVTIQHRPRLVSNSLKFKREACIPEGKTSDDKITMLYAQMHHYATAKKNQGQSLISADNKPTGFVFIDDTYQDGRQPLKRAYQFFSTHPELIPEGMLLLPYHYDHYQGTPKPNLLLPITGTGLIDEHYAETVRYLSRWDEKLNDVDAYPDKFTQRPLFSFERAMTVYRAHFPQQHRRIEQFETFVEKIDQVMEQLWDPELLSRHLKNKQTLLYKLRTEYLNLKEKHQGDLYTALNQASPPDEAKIKGMCGEFANATLETLTTFKETHKKALNERQEPEWDHTFGLVIGALYRLVLSIFPPLTRYPGDLLNGNPVRFFSLKTLPLVSLAFDNENLGQTATVQELNRAIRRTNPLCSGPKR